MESNCLWSSGRYQDLGWRLPDGTIHEHRFWDHIEVACGILSLSQKNTDAFIDSCAIYWREGSAYAKMQNTNADPLSFFALASLSISILSSQSLAVSLSTPSQIHRVLSRGSPWNCIRLCQARHRILDR
jgi:hypothetical protein